MASIFASMARRWSAVLCLALSGVSAGWAEPSGEILTHQDGKILVPEGSPLRQRLVIEPVSTRELRRVLELPAIVEADPARTIRVLPALAGRITALKIGLGDTVAKDQVLAILDSGDLDQAYADLDKARAEADLTEKAVARQRKVEQIGGAAVKDLEQAVNDFAQAQAELARAEARLAALTGGEPGGGKSRQLVIRAPISGSVTELDAAPGAILNDPTQPILVISDLDEVFVTVNVPEKDIAFVAKDQDCDIEFPAYPRQNFTGTVASINALVEPDSHRVKVRIRFGNPTGAFKPNMFADVRFKRASIPQLVLPTSALLMNNDNTTVFVEVSPWRLERRTVDLEYESGGMVSVLNGVALGERVVVRGGVLLND